VFVQRFYEVRVAVAIERGERIFGRRPARRVGGLGGLLGDLLWWKRRDFGGRTC